METWSAEKIYVAIGTDLDDGFATLDWVLKRWSSHSISVVILYADNSIRKDYVYTPIGKMPASSVREETLKVLDKSEEVKSDKILARYVAFCGKVKAEGLKIDRYDEPLHKVLVELITGLRITKLAMALSFMRFSSWKSKGAVNAAFHVHREKPEFCNLSVICGGKPVFLREENNEGIIEDDQGVMVAKLAKLREKVSFRGWLGKMFPENPNGKNHYDSPASSTTTTSPDHWKYNEEIEHYFNQLLNSNANESDPETATETLLGKQPELNFPENMFVAEKIEALKIKICDNQEEAKADAERCAKAKWAIGLCTRRAEEIQFHVKEENARRMALQKDLEITKEELYELQSEVEEKRSKLHSILELQRELSNKLRLSSLAKSRAEMQLEKAVRNRADMVQGIEELRRQRDVLQRRIEFCKEKDAIGMANSLGDFNFDYRKYSAAEIRAATDDFSDRLRLKSAGEWANVYKGRINQITVAIKLFDADGLSQEAFQEKVKLLSHIRHPHILAMIGFCTELKCVVFEYMKTGCLRDTLFSNPRSHNGRKLGLSWHARIRIAAEVCTGLSFLHKAKPSAIVHGNLNPSKILLDKKNVAKIYGFKHARNPDESDIKSDIQAFGTLLLQLLTGRNWGGIGEEPIQVDSAMLAGSLDKMAGDWPLDLAVELGGIAKCCLCIGENQEKEFNSKILMRWIEKVRRKADELVANGDFALAAAEADETTADSSHIPRVCFCPIYQEVMKNPHLAADGFSYELEAIEEWLKTGHDTSPVTNLRLKHKLLTPNHTLRSKFG